MTFRAACLVLEGDGAKALHARHVAEAAVGALKIRPDVVHALLPADARLGPREGDHVVAALDELLGHESANVA